MALVSEDDVLRGIRQLRELEDRFLNGSIDPRDVREPLQRIIEKRFTATPIVPSWYVPPQEQLERVKRLNAERWWGFTNADFPPVPENFAPRTSTEVLLLSVYLPVSGSVGGLQRTFDDLWEAITPSKGYPKSRSVNLNSDSQHLRLAGSAKWKPGIRWVAFDPNAYHGLTPQEALQQGLAVRRETLAGTEVLMAALLFPEWAASLVDDEQSPHPNIGGLQCYDRSNWSETPFLYRWYGGRQLRLGKLSYASADSSWSCPTMREC